MNIDTAEQLRIYKLMLMSYQSANTLFDRRINKISNHVHRGFCYYIESQNYEIQQLSILYKIRPNMNRHHPYWFKEGAIWPRIRLLKKAIRIAEKQLIEDGKQEG